MGIVNFGKFKIASDKDGEIYSEQVVTALLTEGDFLAYINQELSEEGLGFDSAGDLIDFKAGVASDVVLDVNVETSPVLRASFEDKNQATKGYVIGIYLTVED